jgi:NADP-dependent 3-hydroxy acid dehydrogenase YdfG
VTSDGAGGPLAGRAVLAVGASSGIGAACAREAAGAGARVGVIARRRERLDALVAAAGVMSLGSVADTDPAETLRLEAGPRGIKVTTVSPGFVATDLVADEAAVDDRTAAFAERMHDQGLAPEDVAAGVVHVLGLPAHVMVVEYAVSSVRQLGYR